MLLRAYRDDGDPHTLVRDFFATVGADAPANRDLLEQVGYENRRLTTASLVRRRAANFAGFAGGAAPVEQCERLLAARAGDIALPFAPLTPHEQQQIASRFSADTRWLADAWKIDLRDARRVSCTPPEVRRRSRALLQDAEVIFSAGTIA